MNTASEVLVIIVSAVLAIFLAVAIVALVYLIGVLKQAKRITQQAENVADSVHAAASAFERTATPLAVFKLIGNIVGRSQKRRKG